MKKNVNNYFIILIFFFFGCAHNNKYFIELKKNLFFTNDTIVVSILPSGISDQKISHLLFLRNNGTLIKSLYVPKICFSVKLDTDGIYCFAMKTENSTPNKKIIWGEVDQLVLFDYSGRILTELNLKGASHDFDFIKSNTGEKYFYYFEVNEITTKEKRKLKVDGDQFLQIDSIVKIDSMGNKIWQWDVGQYLDQIDKPQIIREGNISLGNSIKVIILKNRKYLLVSFRHFNSVMLIDEENNKIVWQSGPIFQRQHDASFSNGKILVFDNGVLIDIPKLQIAEAIPRENQLDFQVQFHKLGYHYLNTSIMGGVRRLQNGDFLISNSVSGHLTQISPYGEHRWSILLKNIDAKENEISSQKFWLLGGGFFRAEVYSEEEIISFNIFK